jgi:hypothetical protein
MAMLMIELSYSRQLGSNIAIRFMNPAVEPELATGAEVLAVSLG